MSDALISVESFVIAGRLSRRRRAERRFQRVCRCATLSLVIFLAIFVASLLMQGAHIFLATEVREHESSSVRPEGNGSDIINLKSLYAAYHAQTLPSKTTLSEWRLASSAWDERYKKHVFAAFLAQPTWLARHTDHLQAPDHTQGPLSTMASEDGTSRLVLNTYFLTRSDSQEPECAGMKGALLGSFYCLLVALCVSLPLALATAVYLEVFGAATVRRVGAKRRWHRIVWRILDVHIQNLAAVPSIVYGLLGMTLFIGGMGLPRGSSWVGGLTLSLIMLPSLIVVYRLSLRAYPRSLIQGALALGATRMQTVWHLRLPGSLPGIVSGTLLALARVFGESAPLLMLGMVAFVPRTPTSLSDPTTVLPVLILNWTRHPTKGFGDRAAAAVLVMLLILMVINALAMMLQRSSRKEQP